MINIVLVHLGDQLPPYLKACTEQIRRFFNGKVYLLSNIKPDFDINVEYVNINELTCENRESFKKLDFLRDFGLNNFWSYTLERFFVIEAFSSFTGINEIVHIENDILIYHDPDDLNLHNHYTNRVAVNPLGSIFCTASYLYVDNLHAINSMNTQLLFYLGKGKQELMEMFSSEGLVSEMNLLYLLLKNNIVSYLPINIEGVYSDNFKTFNMIFDPASWGQYAGGTPGGGHKPGSLFNNHWVGLHMTGKTFSIDWIKDNADRKIPYLNYKGELSKFGTLHIHSKNLHLYNS